MTDDSPVFVKAASTVPRGISRNTAELAFKSHLPFSIGMHVTFFALISRRNESEKCHVYFNDYRRDLNACDAVFRPLDCRTREHRLSCLNYPLSETVCRRNSPSDSSAGFPPADLQRCPAATCRSVCDGSGSSGSGGDSGGESGGDSGGGSGSGGSGAATIVAVFIYLFI